MRGSGAWVVIAGLMGASTIGLADGKKPTRPPPRRPAPSSSASGQGAGETPAPAEPANHASGVALEGNDGGVRASPLNPESDEFPDGGAPSSPPDLDRILGEIAM